MKAFARRVKRLRTLAVIAAACPFAAASLARAQSQDRPAPMDREFQVLLERSIFSKDGRSRSAAPPSTAPAAPPARVLTPEQSNVFRGVLCPDEEYVAFIENVSSGQVTVLRTGDDVARGKIVGITLDSLAYAAAGKVHDIRLGQNLAGETVSGGASGAVVSGTAATAPSTPLDPAQQSAAERMRLRRLQEGAR